MCIKVEIFKNTKNRDLNKCIIKGKNERQYKNNINIT